MAKILTESLVHMMQQPHKYEIDLIHENTDEDGHTSCIKCEIGRLDDCEKPILVSLGFTEPKTYKFQTYFCNNCDYYHIDGKDARKIRKYLSK